MRSFQKFCDAKFHGSAKAFAAIRPPSQPPIQELQIPITVAAELHWVPTSNQVDCVGRIDDFFPHSPVTISDERGWIVAKHPHHITVQFHSMPVEQPTHADITQSHHVVDPKDIARHLEEYWIPLWQQPPNAQPSDPWPEFDQLLNALPSSIPPLDISFAVKEWHAAIATMKKTSARGIDAISVAELQSLPDLLIQELATIMITMQEFPDHLMISKVCPLSKAENDVPRPSQSRPICVLAMLYRLYARVVCSQILVQWGQWFPADICGMLPQRGAYLAAYTSQVILELSHHTGAKCGGVTLDLIKCFNKIDHEAGYRLLRAMHFPQKQLDFWFKSIRKHLRYWIISGEFLGPVHASCGFPEGDSHSVIMILAIAFAWSRNIREVCSEHIRLSSYADNWTWSSICHLDHAPAAQQTLEVTRLFGLLLDYDKTWYWAVDTATAKLIDQALSTVFPQQVQRKHHARDLGLELQYSGCHSHGHRKSRWEQGMAKLSRVQHAKLSLSVKEHLVLSSVFPGMFHGCEVFPCCQDQLAKVRSKTADALHGPCKSMTPAVALLLAKPCILDPGFFTILSSLRQAITWLRGQPENIQRQFFHIAATFHGHVSKVKGPAASLAVYLLRVGWHVNKDGFVQVDTFISLHLVRDSFQLFRTWLQIAWQTDLVMTYSERYSKFSMPDISRSDTLAVLLKFNDRDRSRLTREVAWGFQDGPQQMKWASDTDGTCPFCHAEDTRAHRLYHCPAFEHVRETHQTDIDAVTEYGATFDELLAITVHPQTMLCRTMQYQEPDPILPQTILALRDNATPDHPLHIYTDGACQGSSMPTTRYTAFACVLDLCATDAEREAQVQAYRQTGVLPNTFQVFAVGRAFGEQTINRAEASAIATAGQLGPHVLLHTDSQYAMSLIDLAKSPQLPSPARDSNLDILHKLRDVNISTESLVKVAAHQKLDPHKPWQELYQAIGNHVADNAAVHAREHLHPPWNTMLQARHCQVDVERNMLYKFMQYILDLQKARAIAYQQLQPEEDAAVPPESRFTQDTIRQKLLEWSPEQIQTVSIPSNLDSWQGYLSWGNSFLLPFFEWMQQLRWPCDPGGPLSREIGVSWLELALSFSHHIAQLLPVIRKEANGTARIFWVKDQQDAIRHDVTLLDLASSFEMLWTQIKSYFPTHFPTVSRERVTSLQAQGFLIHTQGLGLRPYLPHQAAIYPIVQGLKGQRSFNCAITASWCRCNGVSVEHDDWKARGATYRSVRRRVGTS
eukprot:Skav211483  [mRNA]  locus=scaffold2188:99016:102759:+ [translate_table: standard]